MNITWIGCSPANFRKGRIGVPIAIVIHVMDGSLTGTNAWFNNSVSKVSAHYGIGKNGRIVQYVKDEDVAYHAGRILNPTWKSLPGGNPNNYTLGIEHEGFSSDEWPEAMYDASAWLVERLCWKFNIPIDREHIVGHREIYAGKSCPGKGDLEKLVLMANAERVK